MGDRSGHRETRVEASQRLTRICAGTRREVTRFWGMTGIMQHYGSICVHFSDVYCVVDLLSGLEVVELHGFLRALRLVCVAAALSYAYCERRVAFRSKRVQLSGCARTRVCLHWRTRVAPLVCVILFCNLITTMFHSLLIQRLWHVLVRLDVALGHMMRSIGSNEE